jgi:hypothetical protein
MQQFNYFSFNDLFWVRFNSNLVTFGYKGLPENVHWTLSYNLGSSDINLHLSKNVKNVSEEHKPRIYIIRVGKTFLEMHAKELFLRFWKSVMEPIELSEIDQEVLGTYASSNGDGSQVHKEIEERFLEWCKQNSVIKQGTRVKFNVDLTSDIETILTKNIDSESLLEEITINIKSLCEMTFESGVFLPPDGPPIIKIEDKWYRHKEFTSMEPIVAVFFGEEIAKTLCEYVQNSITLVGRANTRQDVAHFDSPMIIS